MRRVTVNRRADAAVAIDITTKYPFHTPQELIPETSGGESHDGEDVEEVKDSRRREIAAPADSAKERHGLRNEEEKDRCCGHSAVSIVHGVVAVGRQAWLGSLRSHERKMSLGPSSSPRSYPFMEFAKPRFGGGLGGVASSLSLKSRAAFLAGIFRARRRGGAGSSLESESLDPSSASATARRERLPPRTALVSSRRSRKLTLTVALPEDDGRDVGGAASGGDVLADELAALSLGFSDLLDAASVAAVGIDALEELGAGVGVLLADSLEFCASPRMRAATDPAADAAGVGAG